MAPPTPAAPATPPLTPRAVPTYAAGDRIATPAPYSCSIIAAGLSGPLCAGAYTTPVPPATYPCACNPCRPVGGMPCITLMPYDKAPWSTHVPGYTTPDTAPCYHPCTMLCYPYIVVSIAYVSACGCAGYNGTCNTGICDAGAYTYTGCCCTGTNCPCHHYAVPVLACYIGCGYYCCGAASCTSLSGPMPSSPSYTSTSCSLFAWSPAIVLQYV